MTAVTIARHGAAFGVYLKTDGPDWTLLTSGTGKDANPEGVVRAVAGGQVTVAEVDAPHLHIANQWVQVTQHMTDATPREILTAEVLTLDAEAARRAESAAYGGEMGDRGAGLLREKADAIRHAVLILTGDPLPERVKTQF